MRSIPAWAGEPGTRRSGLTLRWVYPRVGGGTFVHHHSFSHSFGRVYPRVGGGTDDNLSDIGMLQGLSPRGRGNLCMAVSSITSDRSIPAWAGEPGGGGYWAGVHAVYPRVGGGTHLTPPSALLPQGLSPRGRGNRCPDRPPYYHRRSIPAWAGEPQEHQIPGHQD